MDLFFEDTSLSTSQSARQKTRPEDSQMMEGTSHGTSAGTSSAVNMTDIQESHTSSIIDSISTRVQELVEKINDRRTSDQKVMDSFHELLLKKVTHASQQMKELMFTVYEENSSGMQVKLQELSEVLQSCIRLNNELLEASRDLSHLREGLATPETSESP